ncbi:hypothetical protein I7I53_07634 [Histoplasma capsulatum var. duboisii H88]|uniref:Uncharacterized protein n=1 Tax=Ajellomyces capsulatus (strain H88) TaxID=544711 RepID=A0A8A1LCI4_AJEC8|nr:hypothetical protein I7I53_07634 [Histoplasma capsulatum var. duboisii H88]
MDKTLSALGPKTFRKKEAARIRPEPKISCFGTTTKYATLTSIYKTLASPTPMGAAIFNVRAGFFVSLNDCC